MKRNGSAVDLHGTRNNGTIPRPATPQEQWAKMKAAGRPDRLPPHSPEAEQGVLGCCLLSPELIADRCKFIRPEMFYDLRHATVWSAMKEMTDKRKVVDVITLQQWLKDRKRLEEIGGISYLASLPDTVPSSANLSYYLDIVLEKHALRQTISVCSEVQNRVYDYEGEVESLMLGIRADMETVTSLRAGDKKPALKIWRVGELLKWVPPTHLRLVGDNEISMGYEGLALIAGPGSSGKSLALASLALAGAIGAGTWMGRQVHRRFKTLIIQAENGPVRMKDEITAMARNYPKADLENHVFFSEPPEGGLPFHKPEFRVAVRREIETLKPSLVAIDPYSQLSAEDSSKDVMDKLAEIRSCFPSGDDCPGLVIVAHTKKPRSEDVRRGRSLAYQVSGSVALPNTCRCVYLLLPWNEELEEERIYWACCKLNNGKMYPASVWKRRFGGFFVPDPETDPKLWGVEEKDEDDQLVTYADLLKAFGSEHILRKSDLAKRLAAAGVCSYQTGMRIILPGRGGYLSKHVEITAEGWAQLREDK
jgi:hypothetical protein